jgi:uncharacterized membrane protein
MIKFFTPEEEQRIIAAIRTAEAATTGEIRVHLEENPSGDALTEAKRVFRKLGMHRTVARNGVLILLAPEQRSFAIIGDQAIDQVVAPEFWTQERDLIQNHFRQGDYCAGIIAAVTQVGEVLKAHFPQLADTNENELPDDISYG